MKWMRFRVRTNEESEDIIVSYLQDIGLEGAQIEDNAPLTAQDKEQMFIDAPELEPDEKDSGIESGVAYLNFFVEIDDEICVFLDRIAFAIQLIKLPLVNFED